MSTPKRSSAKRARAKARRPAPDKPAPKKRGRPPGQGHKRTRETLRVVRIMSKLPNITHAQIAEALGIHQETLRLHYNDLIPHEGPGRPEHTPTKLMRTLVAQYKGLGLTHGEIAAAMLVSIDVLEKHYPDELRDGIARTKAQVGHKVLLKALSKDADALRAAQFFLSTQHGWIAPVRLGPEHQPPGAGNDPDPLVNGERKITRQDARKVAFMLARAAHNEAHAVEVVEEGLDDDMPSTALVVGSSTL